MDDNNRKINDWIRQQAGINVTRTIAEQTAGSDAPDGQHPPMRGDTPDFQRQPVRSNAGAGTGPQYRRVAVTFNDWIRQAQHGGNQKYVIKTK